LQAPPFAASLHRPELSPRYADDMGDNPTFKLFVSHAAKDDSKNAFEKVEAFMSAKDITVFNPTTHLSDTKIGSAGCWATVNYAINSSSLSPQKCCWNVCGRLGKTQGGPGSWTTIPPGCITKDDDCWFNTNENSPASLAADMQKHC
jgi:hypothetical protein